MLVSSGRFREAETLALLTGAHYPARNPAQNIADLKAQVAANARGAALLQQMIDEFSLDVVEAYMGHVQDNAEESVRRVIARLTDSHFHRRDSIRERASRVAHPRRSRRGARRQSTSREPRRSSPTISTRPSPITRAACLYVFRVLVGGDIPMNAGCLRPLKIVVPQGSMLAPRCPAAVVAGNVETSQNVVDCLFGALGALGSAQGTMNNLTFGNARSQYYETICSGAPAGEGFDGAGAVHTHMTNSRLTDPEVLELRFPVVLEDFHVRRGSGGKGRLHARRRRQPHDPLPGRHGACDPLRPAARALLWRSGRRAGRTGAQFRAPRETGASRSLRAALRRTCRGGRDARHPSSRPLTARGLGRGRFRLGSNGRLLSRERGGWREPAGGGPPSPKAFAVPQIRPSQRS